MFLNCLWFSFFSNIALDPFPLCSGLPEGNSSPLQFQAQVCLSSITKYWVYRNMFFFTRCSASDMAVLWWNKVKFHSLEILTFPNAHEKAAIIHFLAGIGIFIFIIITSSDDLAVKKLLEMKWVGTKPGVKAHPRPCLHYFVSSVWSSTLSDYWQSWLSKWCF